jgi:uncharacterized OB-fold protein
VPGVEAGAVYVPGFVSEGRPVAGPDEDAFTLAATAWEGLPPLPAGAPSPRSLHLVGSFPRMVDWGFAALLGHPVELVTHPAGLSGLSEALAQVEAAGPDGPPQLLLGVQIPERSGPDSGPDLGVGAGAVALRFAAAGSLSRAERSLLLEGPDVVSAAKVVLASRGVDPPGPTGHRGLSLGSIRPFVEAPVTAVSEGAYVPRARYLENLASRWRLVAERCGHCGSLTFPARGVCRSCSAREGLSPHPLPRDGGTVVAVTTIGQGGQPTEFDLQVAALGEYAVALVELAPGVVSTLQVTDASPGEVRIGTRVATRLRRLYPMEGEWRYGRKALPLP